MSARRHAAAIDAVVLNLPGASASPIVLGAPGPGWFVAARRRGDVVGPGAVLGELDVLGRRTTVRVPAGVHGAIVSDDAASARVAVGFRHALCALDASVTGAATTATERGIPATTDDTGGLLFRAPSGGRYYGRPSPGKPAFVSVGDIVAAGQTVCMLEVMKTFHRVSYGGDGLPPRARIDAILVTDEADVASGEPVLRLTPA